MKKLIILICFLTTINFFIFSNEKELAKNFLQKSYLLYQKNNYQLCKEYLEKSYEYEKNLPEYFYISNLLLKDNKENLYNKNNNAKQILKYLKNNFLIEEFDLLTQCIEIFNKTMDYDNSIKTYNQIYKFTDKNLLSYYLKNIEILFYMNKLDYFNNLLEQAKKEYYSLDFNFFEIKYKILKKLYEKIKDFDNDLNILISNNYSYSKIFYLKTLFYSDQKNVISLFKEYSNNKKNLLDNSEYHKSILYNLLLKSYYLTDKNISFLLDEWINQNGLFDYRTNEILLKNNIIKVINKNKDYINKILKFSGNRIKDIDNDNNWELNEKYIDGILVEKQIDLNQDGIIEEIFKFQNNGKNLEYTKFIDKINFYKYIFNINDSSLLSIEYYNNNKIVQKDILYPGKYFPDIYKLKNDEINFVNNIYLNKNILSFLNNRENFNEKGEKYIIKYYKQEIKTILKDTDNDGYYETKEFYDNNKLYEVIKDIDKDNKYEILEKYYNNQLTYFYYKSNPFYKNYDYYEKINNNSIEKYWDNNNDQIYEICLIEYNQNDYNILFDINFDKIYDYEIEYKNKNPYKLYSLKNNRKLLKLYNIFNEEKLKNWVIITSRDLNDIIIPDNIDYKINNNKYEGLFYYNNKKYYFENNIIKCDYFAYRFLVLTDKLKNVYYLFDIMNDYFFQNEKL